MNQLKPLRRTLKVIPNQKKGLSASKVYFRPRAETRRAENISARLGSAWHASVLDKENIAVLKPIY